MLSFQKRDKRLSPSQNFASPSEWVTWMCLRLSYREKKKNRKSPSRKTVGDKHAPHLLLTIDSLCPPRKGKSSCSRSQTFRPRALRIGQPVSFQRHSSAAGLTERSAEHCWSCLSCLMRHRTKKGNHRVSRQPKYPYRSRMHARRYRQQPKLSLKH